VVSLAPYAFFPVLNSSTISLYFSFGRLRLSTASLDDNSSPQTPLAILQRKDNWKWFRSFRGFRWEELSSSHFAGLLGGSVCVWKIAFLLALIPMFLGAHTNAQESLPPGNSPPMVLTGAIPLPNVQGRIDHLGVDPKGRLFVSALGNNTEEVIDLAAGIRNRTINGIPNPQGVVYVSELNKLFVGSDAGKLYVYDGNSFELLSAIDFGNDVDNVRYDAATKRIYVGFGDAESGAIGEVDATTNKRLDQVFKLGAHPESFQLEKSGPHMYVNLPELKQVADIDRTMGTIARWPLDAESNFPMALDKTDRRIFVVTRAPARLVVLDANTGRVIATLPCVQN
jgi:hypothetical protein